MQEWHRKVYTLWRLGKSSARLTRWPSSFSSKRCLLSLVTIRLELSHSESTPHLTAEMAVLVHSIQKSFCFKNQYLHSLTQELCDRMRVRTISSWWWPFLACPRLEIVIFPQVVWDRKQKNESWTNASDHTCLYLIVLSFMLSNYIPPPPLALNHYYEVSCL